MHSIPVAMFFAVLGCLSFLSQGEEASCPNQDAPCSLDRPVSGNSLLQQTRLTTKEQFDDGVNSVNNQRIEELKKKHPTLVAVNIQNRRHEGEAARPIKCQDTNTQEGWEEGKVGKDKEGDLCKGYKGYEEFCGAHDDEDFKAKEMCCICGGGTNFDGPRSLAPGKDAKLMISPAGQGCSRGFSAIHSIAGCRAAMEVLGRSGMYFEGTENDKNFPRGCYAHDSGIFFNTHPKGSNEAESGSFCQRGFKLDAGKLVFVGDSDLDYLNTLPYFPDSYNVAVGGYQCGDVLKEQDMLVDAFMPSEWVSLSCGENDIEGGCRDGCSPETSFKRWKKVVDAFTAQGSRILYYSTKRGPDQKESYRKFGQFDSMVREHIAELAQHAAYETRKPPIVMINMSGSFDAHSNPRDFYQSDGLHQSAKAYDLVIAWAQQAMKSDTSCMIWNNGHCQTDASEDSYAEEYYEYYSFDYYA